MFHSDQKSAREKHGKEAKTFNFLAAEHDKHETIVALNKICKIITKTQPHTYAGKTKDLGNERAAGVRVG